MMVGIDKVQLTLFAGDTLSTEKIQKILQTTQQEIKTQTQLSQGSFSKRHPLDGSQK